MGTWRGKTSSNPKVNEKKSVGVQDRALKIKPDFESLKN